MSTTYTLSRPIPLAEFTANLPDGITVDRVTWYPGTGRPVTGAWEADGHSRANLLLRTRTDCLHAFAEDGMVLSLERYGGNKAEPMVLAICERFGVKMEADFAWTYPDDGRCEKP